MDNFKEYLKDAQKIINESSVYSDINTAKRLLRSAVKYMEDGIKDSINKKLDKPSELKKVKEAGQKIDEAIKTLLNLEGDIF